MALDMTLRTCRAASTIAAALHLALIRAGAAQAPRLFDASNLDMARLRDCWFARCAREVLALALRSPLRASALDLVSFEDAPGQNGGHIIAVCHSPWGRLLSHWCRERGSGLAFAAPGWNRHLGDAHVAGGYRELRRLVKHLKGGGRAFVVVDVFPQRRGCPVRFLGLDRLASMVAVRLSAAAGVPIIPAVPVFRGGYIEVIYGTANAAPVREERADVVRSLLEFVETQIRACPASWHGTMQGWLRPRG
jgi:lauroyl/myristoyl acyltransferase